MGSEEEAARKQHLQQLTPDRGSPKRSGGASISSYEQAASPATSQLRASRYAPDRGRRSVAEGLQSPAANASYEQAGMPPDRGKPRSVAEGFNLQASKQHQLRASRYAPR